MARILQLGVKAEEAPKCLACHTLYSSPEQKGRAFEISEGVSCENCHGPASAWLGPHTTRAWAHDKSISLGMYDTRNVIRRTEKCMECHLGTKDKFVDHEMIAAGHPDLFFELDSFSAVIPRHWKVPRESEPDKPAEDGAWVGVREWSTRQGAQLCARLPRPPPRSRSDSLRKYQRSHTIRPSRCRCCIASPTMMTTFPSLTIGRPNKRPWLWTRSSSPIVGMRIPQTPPMSAPRSTA